MAKSQRTMPNARATADNAAKPLAIRKIAQELVEQRPLAGSVLVGPRREGALGRGGGKPAPDEGRPEGDTGSLQELPPLRVVHDPLPFASRARPRRPRRVHRFDSGRHHSPPTPTIDQAGRGL